jgi:hypothetical protein
MASTTSEFPVESPTPAPATDGAALPAHKPDGVLSAALIACGIGSFVLGLLTTLAEADADFKARLSLDDDVGPLSGKTLWASVAFVVGWVVLTALLRGRDGTLRNATIAFVVLTGLGFLMTFPIFFQAFAE